MGKDHFVFVILFIELHQLAFVPSKKQQRTLLDRPHKGLQAPLTDEWNRSPDRYFERRLSGGIRISRNPVLEVDTTALGRQQIVYTRQRCRIDTTSDDSRPGRKAARSSSNIWTYG